MEYIIGFLIGWMGCLTLFVIAGHVNDKIHDKN
jgi:hypothetical protein